MPTGSEVRASRAQPQAITDGLLVLPRGDRYGAGWLASVTSSDHHHAEEGSYILATNPAIGTGQTWVAAQTAFSDTAPNWYIFNNDNTRSLWLRRLKLQCSAVGTAAVSWRYAVILDPVARALTTDNTLAITPTCPNSGTSPITTPTIKVQNSATVSVIAASSASKRIAAIGTLGGLNIAGSEFEVIFGGVEAAGYSGVADAAGQPSRKVTQSGPVVIGPGHSATIHVWGPTSSASINPEWEMGLIAR